MQTAPSAPPQTWQAPNGIPTHVTHAQMIAPRPQNIYAREDQWDGPPFGHLDSADVNNTLPAINGGQTDGYYDQRYRNDQNGWPDSAPGYYDQAVCTLKSRTTIVSEKVCYSHTLRILQNLLINSSHSRNNSNNSQSRPLFHQLLVRLLNRNNKKQAFLRILVQNGNREEESGLGHR